MQIPHDDFYYYSLLIPCSFILLVIKMIQCKLMKKLIMHLSPSGFKKDLAYYNRIIIFFGNSFITLEPFHYFHLLCPIQLLEMQI